MDANTEVLLTTVFNDRRDWTMVLDRMFKMAAVRVEIVRGRLSAKGCWFNIKVSGKSGAVEQAVDTIRPWTSVERRSVARPRLKNLIHKREQYG
ncbi:MAG TPA: BMC domain-containing protein [Planctomycetota bacterium]|nr:BMC domain-containing protein [Planctomycetota bacterium]